MTEKEAVGKWEEIRSRVLAEPSALARYENKRDTIITMRQVLQAIDEERERRHLSKSELANLAGMQPAAVRRLLTSESSNPTLRTVISVMDALGFEIELRPKTMAQESIHQRLGSRHGKPISSAS